MISSAGLARRSASVAAPIFAAASLLACSASASVIIFSIRTPDHDALCAMTR